MSYINVKQKQQQINLKTLRTRNKNENSKTMDCLKCIFFPSLYLSLSPVLVKSFPAISSGNAKNYQHLTAPHCSDDGVFIVVLPSPERDARISACEKNKIPNCIFRQEEISFLHMHDVDDHYYYFYHSCVLDSVWE
jgi:hypothetical protein